LRRQDKSVSGVDILRLSRGKAGPPTSFKYAIKMSLLSAAVNTPLLPMLDRASTSSILAQHDDGYYRTSESPPNTDGPDESPNSLEHSNEGSQKVRKFICKYCARKFLRAEHLRRHEITRTRLPFRVSLRFRYRRQTIPLPLLQRSIFTKVYSRRFNCTNILATF
jgi:hypothetical protein